MFLSVVRRPVDAFWWRGEESEKTADVHLSNTVEEEGKASEANEAQEASFLILSST